MHQPQKFREAGYIERVEPTEPNLDRAISNMYVYHLVNDPHADTEMQSEVAQKLAREEYGIDAKDIWEGTAESKKLRGQIFLDEAIVSLLIFTNSGGKTQINREMFSQIKLRFDYAYVKAAQEYLEANPDGAPAPIPYKNSHALRSMINKVQKRHKFNS